jgi:indole-3-glycerol phosphate synthase
LAYADAGAAAISVLTEPSRFDGALSHLTQAASGLAGRIPVMRKDFLVDAYQVYEARVAGAGGVLIILRMLARAELEALIEAAAQLGLFALLEAFDDTDLRAAELVREYAARTSLLVGVNCRDLVTLKVVPGGSRRWRRCCRAACRAWPKAASPPAAMRRAWRRPPATMSRWWAAR